MWQLVSKFMYHLYVLVGGLEHFLCFYILGIIIPIDEIIFFIGVGQPSTSIIHNPGINQLTSMWQVSMVSRNRSRHHAQTMLRMLCQVQMGDPMQQQAVAAAGKSKKINPAKMGHLWIPMFFFSACLFAHVSSVLTRFIFSVHFQRN